jgi:hypothetical protein
MVAVERLPPWSASFTVMDYKMPASIVYQESHSRKPLLPTYFGHIGTKPVYDTYGPLKSMDGILIRTKSGVWEVTTEECGKLKGYPATWGTTAADRRRIIREPSLHFWSVLGDDLTSTLGKEEKDCCCENEDEDPGLMVMILLSTRQCWEEDSFDDESDSEDDPPP